MTGDRLRLDRATLVDPVADTLPAADAEAKEPAALVHRGRPLATTAP